MSSVSEFSFHPPISRSALNLHSRHGAAMLGHEAKVHARLLIHLVAARPFQVEQTREQIRARIHRHHTAHHAADFQIKERRYQLLDQAPPPGM